MKAANRAKARSEQFRMLSYSKEKNRFQTIDVKNIDQIIPVDSLVIVNDAATFPARIKAYREEASEIVELRFFPFLDSDETLSAFIFSSYAWHLPTEERKSPQNLRIGEVISIPKTGIRFAVEQIKGRLLTLSLNVPSSVLMRELYRRGEMIQYSYHQKKLRVFDAQTLYGGEPWAAEMPSAGYFLTSEIISNLKKAGVSLASLTHQTGLSSSGDPETDASLPLPEYFCIADSTLKLIAEKRAAGKKIIAVGTSVVRALESLESLEASQKLCKRTPLKITSDHKNKWVDGIISGLHSEEESHFQLLEAFACKNALKKMTEIAVSEGLHSHEFGDLCLIV